MKLPDDDQLHQIQNIQTRCLKRIHDFCEENSIRYFMIGGTLIGAVRHGGPIPWDDDVDIGMPRKDYEKFLKICDRLGAPYSVHHPGNDLEHVQDFAKCYDTNSQLVEHTHSSRVLSKNLIRGVWVDIFPFDGTFSCSFFIRCHFLLISIARKARLYKKGAGMNCYGRFRFFKKIIKKITSLGFKLVPARVFDFLLSYIIKLKKIDRSDYVGNLLGRWGEREVCEKSIIEKIIYLEYENYKFCAPSSYDKYLEKIYGDYMRLPPKAERSGHHITIIKLEG